jgi:hypothetical protein
MKIPNRFLEIDGEEAYKKILSNEISTNPKNDNGEEVTFNLSIDKKDYIKIPHTNLIISKREILKNLNWYDSHFQLNKEGLFMPSPSVFMPYFINVKQAAEGNLTLYDGNNNPISQDESQNLWNYLTTNYGGGCWSWLDAKFEEENEGLYLFSNHRILNGELHPSLKQRLLDHINEDCFVNLDFNNQGMPIRKSLIDEYKQGNNLYYWHPRKGSVAGLVAYSDGASLLCSGVPSYSDDGLGVFACAEGTQKNRSSR